MSKLHYTPATNTHHYMFSVKILSVLLSYRDWAVVVSVSLTRENFFSYLSPPPHHRNTGEYMYWSHSICPSVCVSDLVCMIQISLTAQPFLTKLGMVVYYHGVECHAEKLVHYLQFQGHSKGLYNQNMTISTITSELLVNQTWFDSIAS